MWILGNIHFYFFPEKNKSFLSFSLVTNTARLFSPVEHPCNNWPVQLAQLSFYTSRYELKKNSLPKILTHLCICDRRSIAALLNDYHKTIRTSLYWAFSWNIKRLAWSIYFMENISHYFFPKKISKINSIQCINPFFSIRLLSSQTRSIMQLDFFRLKLKEKMWKALDVPRNSSILLDAKGNNCFSGEQNVLYR